MSEPWPTLDDRRSLGLRFDGPDAAAANQDFHERVLAKRWRATPYLSAGAWVLSVNWTPTDAKTLVNVAASVLKKRDATAWIADGGDNRLVGLELPTAARVHVRQAFREDPVVQVVLDQPGLQEVAGPPRTFNLGRVAVARVVERELHLFGLTASGDAWPGWNVHYFSDLDPDDLAPVLRAHVAALAALETSLDAWFSSVDEDLVPWMSSVVSGARRHTKPPTTSRVRAAVHTAPPPLQDWLQSHLITALPRPPAERPLTWGSPPPSRYAPWPRGVFAYVVDGVAPGWDDELRERALQLNRFTWSVAPQIDTQRFFLPLPEDLDPRVAERERMQWFAWLWSLADYHYRGSSTPMRVHDTSLGLGVYFVHFYKRVPTDAFWWAQRARQAGADLLGVTPFVRSWKGRPQTTSRTPPTAPSWAERSGDLTFHGLKRDVAGNQGWRHWNSLPFAVVVGGVLWTWDCASEGHGPLGLLGAWRPEGEPTLAKVFAAREASAPGVAALQAWAAEHGAPYRLIDDIVDRIEGHATKLQETTRRLLTDAAPTARCASVLAMARSRLG